MHLKKVTKVHFNIGRSKSNLKKEIVKKNKIRFASQMGEYAKDNYHIETPPAVTFQAYDQKTFKGSKSRGQLLSGRGSP